MICISRPRLAEGLALSISLLRYMPAQRKPAGGMGASEAQFIKCGQEFGPDLVPQTSPVQLRSTEKIPKSGPEFWARFYELGLAGRHNRQNLKRETHRPPSLHPPRPLIRNLASGTASWWRMKGSMVGSSKNQTQST